MEHILQTYGYLAIFALSLISAMCLPVGAEIAVMYGGALASGKLGTDVGHHHLNVVLVVLVAVLGELVGSGLGYGLGYLGGRPLVDKAGKYVLLTHKDLDRADDWFARRGEPVVLFGRFIPLVRSFISLAAGLGEMALAKFAAFTVIGCTIWCAALAGLGYSLAGNWEHVEKDFSYAGYAIGLLVVVFIALLFWHRLRVVRAERSTVVAGADSQVSK